MSATHESEDGVLHETEAERDAYDFGAANGQWVAMRAAVRLGSLRCACCDTKPATCIGAYEASVPVLPACDDCCGHGCEDGACELIERIREVAS